MKRDIQLALVSAPLEWRGPDGRQHRREEWSIRGGEVEPTWQRNLCGQEPASRFTLYIIDGAVDPRLASYGGVVWPTAWPELFVGAGRLGGRSGIEVTDLLLEYREAALHGECKLVDARKGVEW